MLSKMHIIQLPHFKLGVIKNQLNEILAYYRNICWYIYSNFNENKAIIGIFVALLWTITSLNVNSSARRFHYAKLYLHLTSD